MEVAARFVSGRSVVLERNNHSLIVFLFSKGGEKTNIKISFFGLVFCFVFFFLFFSFLDFLPPSVMAVRPFSSFFFFSLSARIIFDPLSLDRDFYALRGKADESAIFFPSFI